MGTFPLPFHHLVEHFDRLVRFEVQDWHPALLRGPPTFSPRSIHHKHNVSPLECALTCLLHCAQRHDSTGTPKKITDTIEGFMRHWLFVLRNARGLVVIVALIAHARSYDVHHNLLLVACGPVACSQMPQVHFLMLLTRHEDKPVVTFTTLHSHCRHRALELWMSITDEQFARAGRSVHLFTLVAVCFAVLTSCLTTVTPLCDSMLPVTHCGPQGCGWVCRWNGDVVLARAGFCIALRELSWGWGPEYTARVFCWRHERGPCECWCACWRACWWGWCACWCLFWCACNCRKQIAAGDTNSRVVEGLEWKYCGVFTSAFGTSAPPITPSPGITTSTVTSVHAGRTRPACRRHSTSTCAFVCVCVKGEQNGGRWVVLINTVFCVCLVY